VKAHLKKRGSQIVRITHNGAEQHLIKPSTRDIAREICAKFNALPPQERYNIKDGIERLKQIRDEVEANPSPWISKIQSISKRLALSLGIPKCSPDLLAKHFGVDQSTIWRWLEGQTPTINHQLLIVEIDKKL